MKMASGKIVPMSAPFGSKQKAQVRRFLICLSYYEGDREAAEDLLLLIAELERTRNHDADILINRRNDARDISAPVKAKLELKFNKVVYHTCRRSDARGYPFAPNQMFSDLVMLMAHSVPFATDYTHWLNMETDAVPTRPGWIGELTAEWRRIEATGKAAMGYIHNDPVPHLNGMAVYSPSLLKRVPQLIGSSPSVCYDIWHSKRILPHAEGTPLIKFDYRKATIAADELFGDPSVALYHGVKDRSARLAVRGRHVTFTDRPKNAISAIPAEIKESMNAQGQSLSRSMAAAERAPIILHQSDHKLEVSHLQDPTDFTVPSLETPDAEVLIGSTLGTQKLASGNRVPVENPVTIRVAEAPAKRPNVYTYSHKHDGVAKAELAAILAAWTKGWTSRGWNPVVLTLRDAAKHVKFDEFQAKVEKLPCVGDKNRMAHRFYRWLALDVVGGGLMTDWDVLPADFGPKIIAQHMEPNGLVRLQTTDDKIVGLYAGKNEATKFVATIMAYDAQPDDGINGYPHVADTTVIKHTIEAAIMAPTIKHFDTGTKRKSVAMEKFLESPHA